MFLKFQGKLESKLGIFHTKSFWRLLNISFFHFVYKLIIIYHCILSDFAILFLTLVCDLINVNVSLWSKLKKNILNTLLKLQNQLNTSTSFLIEMYILFSLLVYPFFRMENYFKQFTEMHKKYKGVKIIHETRLGCIYMQL